MCGGFLHNLSKVWGWSFFFKNSYVHAAFIWSKYSKIITIVILFLSILSNVIYSCDGEAELSASLLQSVSHDPSEIILICWFNAQ